MFALLARHVIAPLVNGSVEDIDGIRKGGIDEVEFYGEEHDNLSKREKVMVWLGDLKRMQFIAIADVRNIEILVDCSNSCRCWFIFDRFSPIVTSSSSPIESPMPTDDFRISIFL